MCLGAVLLLLWLLLLWLWLLWLLLLPWLMVTVSGWLQSNPELAAYKDDPRLTEFWADMRSQGPAGALRYVHLCVVASVTGVDACLPDTTCVVAACTAT